MSETTNHLKKPLPLVMPNISFGIKCIEQFNAFMNEVHMGTAVTENVEAYYFRTLKKIFDAETARHLKGKFSFEDVAGFFLNLDNKNQLRLLRHFMDYEFYLTMPEIPNYKEIGEKFGLDDWEYYDQEDVRIMAVGFNELNEWDAYPHALVWIRRWCLYTINNSINDPGYTGDKFGNYTNWHKYWRHIRLQTNQKINLVQLLISYS